MNSELYLNGAHVRSQPYGYSTFVVDISAWLNRTAHGANVLALRVDNSGRNSRWFSGSGIYRHVRLAVRDDLMYRLAIGRALRVLRPSALESIAGANHCFVIMQHLHRHLHLPSLHPR